MGISNEKHVLNSSGEIVYRSPWMSEAMRYADERGYTVIRDQSNGQLTEKDEYGVWIRQDNVEGQIVHQGPSLTRFDVPPNLHKLPSGLDGDTKTPSDLLPRLLEMAANPPGFNGISTPDGVLGNRYIDLGWVAAVRMVIEMVTAGRQKDTVDSKIENSVTLI